MTKLLILSEITLIYSIFEFICSASAVVIFADINMTWRHSILQESPGLQWQTETTDSSNLTASWTECVLISAFLVWRQTLQDYSDDTM